MIGVKTENGEVRRLFMSGYDETALTCITPRILLDPGPLISVLGVPAKNAF